jgi:NAD(P)-dependent dehydrogenase (short-subunit alcohol dehydrogenase family)
VDLPLNSTRFSIFLTNEIHLIMETKQPPSIARLGLSPHALKGKVVIVTGGGRGIGREIVRAFAWLGARLVIAEIADTGLETQQIVTTEGGAAQFIRTDVSSETDVAALVRRSLEMFGPADILVNNAILCPSASVLDMDVVLWDQVMAVNLRGTFLMCKAFLPQMLEQSQGTIINMISTDAMPYLSAYIASKAGIAAFTQSLAGEVGEQGVRVIAFAPGFVDTPGLRAAAQGLASHMGLTVEKFLKLPLHPAYPGAMPAEDAGAATAYLATVLADEYHGEQVTGYTVLERAGLIKPDAAPALGSLPVEPAGASASTVPGKEPVQALGLAQRLLGVIEETRGEMGRFPVFIRPMVRQGFKGKSGQSIQDWKRMLETLAGQLKQMANSAGRSGDFEAGLPRLRLLLGKLEVYYREAPQEAGRFIKDAQALAELQQIATQRQGIIRDLLRALEGLSG